MNLVIEDAIEVKEVTKKREVEERNELGKSIDWWAGARC
jgi:hypothetical protein